MPLDLATCVLVSGLTLASMALREVGDESVLLGGSYGRKEGWRLETCREAIPNWVGVKEE